MKRCFLCDRKAVARVKRIGDQWQYACLEHTQMIENSLLGRGKPILYCQCGMPFTIAMPAKS